MKYATLPESCQNSFWLNRGMKKQGKQQQMFTSFLVLDFEATCERGTAIEPQEIIEFPCIKINAKTCEVEDIFHQYVQPKEIPILTPFCIELTGIMQAFSAATGYFPRGIIDMLTKLQLPHQGRLHSGIDDCHNIAAILKALISRGFVFEETSHLNLDKI